MPTQRSATVQNPAGHEERDRRAWVAPAVATGLAALLGPLAALCTVGLAFASDACYSHCSAAYDAGMAWIVPLFVYGLPLGACALLTAWLLPWRHRWARVRAWVSLAALVPPVGILIATLATPTP